MIRFSKNKTFIVLLLTLLIFTSGVGCNKIFRRPKEQESKQSQDQKKSPPKILVSLENTTETMIKSIQEVMEKRAEATKEEKSEKQGESSQEKERVLEVEKGTTLEELLMSHGIEQPIPVVAAMVDNKLQELTHTLEEDAKVDFVDLSSKDGVRIYVRGLTFLFIRACRETFPECRVTIEHSMSKGLYCEVHGNFTLSPSKVKRVEQRMKEIVELNEPFERRMVSMEEAREIFGKMGFQDKLEILEYRQEETMRLYTCGWMTD